MIADELFNFVTKRDVRQQLTNDLNELHDCMNIGVNKASAVLIGSLIECVLYYHIQAIDSIKTSIPGFEKREMALSDLLQVARKHNIIDEGLFRLSEPIREYRNLIHPRVQLRTNVQLSENLIQIAYNVLHEIIRSVNLHRDLLESTNRQAIVKRNVADICRRAATKADYQVYVPILEKYGNSRGTLLLQRTLRAGRRRKS